MRPDRIETPRLVLRRARETDRDALHALFTDLRVMRYWSRPPHTDMAETEMWLADMIGAPAAESDDFVIEHAGAAVGKAGAWRLPEVGFLLAPHLWGQGLGTEVMRAVVAHLFAVHDLSALTAEVDPRNAASLRLLARLGFHETGRAERTLLWGDEWCDSIYLALPRPGA